MKKLLVTVIGAAAAIGAFADYTNAQRFEGMELGSTTISALSSQAGGYLSEYADSTKTNEYTIVEMDSENYVGDEPAAFTSTPTNALSVKTQFGKPLEFAVGNTAREIGSGLYFDSLVKFTVCDTEPAQEYSDAKIVMWLQGDEDTTTNLMVKAGKLSVGQGGVEVVSAIYTNGNAIAADFADKWHRVTIKAISNITTDSTVVVPAFAIYIDEEPYAASDAKWDGTFTYGLTPTAAELNVTGALFPSLKQDSNEASNGTLTCAGFDGTGSLNDLVFTDVAPDFAADIVPDVVTVDIGGTTTDYPSLAAAIEAISSASGDITFTLLGGITLDAPVEFSGDANIVLDFAGCVITNTIADAIITNSAALTITDSVGNGGIYCTEQDAYALCQTGDGSLAISGGCFWGNVDFDEALTVEISGGSFKQDSAEIDDMWIVEGKVLSEEPNAETGLYDIVDEEEPLTGWALYLGMAAVDGAYEIDNLAELKAFQANVGTLATAGETFKLTADIALDEAWPGIGIQNGKDLVSSKTQSDVDAFDAGAFQGTFDGQNHTISGFQMIGKGDNAEGLDYCGFFNSTYGATIQNLKIAYAGSLFAADTTDSTKESGATFVGVAKNSTLRNLTTVAGTVSCSKGFGGIVGFLMAGSTVDSCTNNVNMTSLASNKAGGIAMITQAGSGSAIVRNCVNNGTTAGNAKQKGGLIGYVGVATTIENCTVTAASEPTFLSYNTGTVTVSGVNRAPASALPCKDTNGAAKTISGLTFATVDNDGVATFVADNALAAGNTYKVMGPSATATYAFDAAGTIAFDTALATPTYAVTAADSLILTDATADDVKTYTAVVAGAEIAGTKFATLADALASPLVTNATVTLLQDATTGAISTPAATLDLNGKTLTLSGTTALTFTGTGAKTLKGGDLMGVYHELTITAPAGENLTFDGMTFHASVMPNGSGALLTATNCQFLCDYDKTGAVFTDGSTADVHSYGLLFNSNTLFAQADVVNNYFDQGRRAAVQASIGGDLYFYGNTVVADKLTSRVDGAGTRYPALQIISNGGVFIENNSFSGQYLGEAFCVYNKGAYRTTGAPIVFSGNTVANDVTYLWGIYDVDATGAAALVNPDIYFGANTIGANVDLEHCIYKTTVDGIDMNGVTYTYAQNLALPAGVDSIYAWTHAEGAKDLYVNGVAADAVAAGTVIALPGAAVASDTCILTADATLKNQYTAVAAAAKVGNTLYATFKEAVDAANAGDTVVVLADCTVAASVSFTKNVTVTNNYTIAANVDYALCIGATVTFEGSGMIQRASNISGSAFCVGANEKTRGAITVGTAGTLIFNGGTICGGNGGNQIKLENGTVEMNGGVLKDGLRGIKADADAGSYTSAIVINGGTITNCSAYAVFASAESATGKATITINGGVIAGVVGKAGKGDETITIPGTSTAKFDRDQSAFCASGYETTLSDGWYVVTEIPPAPAVEPIDTTAGSSATYADATAATDAAAAINADKETLITVDDNVPAADKTTYLSKVEAVAAGNTVTIQFTAAAAEDAQDQADADNASLPLADIAAADVSADATVTATPGFYYTVESGTAPDALTAGEPVLATGNTVTLPIPNKGAAGFYRIKITPTK